ncbi:DAK2 domain-containing protein [Cellulomonas persica]|uniref:Dihydroxyacetone kinase n=1 Tax=Cellulomonas persica TaxID=76861 RepID=A0A510URY7_9CELL|nr:DAK2 domain-containing protein [Cellulomonas persica]GEK17216.1 dihydroxyacetone kinase [Cellulomonas persica]
MTLEVAQAIAWVDGARAGLAQARGRIDAVNVFPVADGDTGTNAWLTLEGGARAVDEVRVRADQTGGPDAADVLSAFARGAMLAARGNSGVILSQWLAGFARRVTGAGPDERAGVVLADALRAAARAARQALADPQEGTVLTLADEVADAAVLGADAGAPTATVLAQSATAGHQALARISATHPVLRRAHVPDAGACALLVVVDALVAGVAGDAAPGPVAWLPERGSGHDEPAPQECGAGHAAQGGAFEVMLVVRDDGPRDLAEALRRALGQVGDSVAVVGADGWWHAHVHTDEPAAAIEACALGRREQVVVRRLDVVELGVDAGPGAGWGLVVVTASPGLASWYATAGAVVVVRCPEEPVTAAHVRRAVEDTGRRDVLVLPGGAVTGAELEALLELDGVELLGADDEARAAVATLAFVTGDGSAQVHAAALATGRVRVAALEPATARASLAEAVAHLVGAAPADEHAAPSRPESLTVVVPGPLEDDLAARVEAAAAAHGLEPTILSDATAPAVLVAVD